jgi:hypothetical protein
MRQISRGSRSWLALSVLVLMLLSWTHSIAALETVHTEHYDSDPEVEPVDFLMLAVTDDYGAAYTMALEVATRLDLRLDLRELIYDVTHGLTWSPEQCDEETWEYPCYIARGRFDDGVYVSVEPADVYDYGMSGQYVVIAASGDQHEEGFRTALNHAQRLYPEATVHTVPVFMGCVH